MIATTDDRPGDRRRKRLVPESDVAAGVLIANEAKSLCYWKGVASCYDVSAGDATLRSAALTYRRPSPLARIKGRVAFWNGVTVTTGRATH